MCVLERGQEWLPGDFPEDLVSMVGADRSIHPRGRFDLYAPTESDLDIISASGVGGTSERAAEGIFAASWRAQRGDGAPR